MLDGKGKGEGGGELGGLNLSDTDTYIFFSAKNNKAELLKKKAHGCRFWHKKVIAFDVRKTQSLSGVGWSPRVVQTKKF